MAEEDGQRPRILLEVNVAGEGSKFGFKPGALESELEAIVAELPRLEVAGLMAIPPFTPKPEESRRYFAALRELRDRLQEKLRVGLPQLSMGMSNDYEVAIQEGATLVRVGTAIFGERRGKAWRPEGGQIRRLTLICGGSRLISFLLNLRLSAPICGYLPLP